MRTALITGGSMGLGRALAGALVGEGYGVVIDGRDPDRLAEAAAATGAVGLPGDVCDAAHRAALVALVERRFGRLDLLINNASALGPSPLPTLERLQPAALRGVLETNVVAPHALTQACLALLRPGGTVLNVSSDAAVGAYPGWGGYGASKAALDHLSGVLAAEEPELRVWALDPGDLRTAMHQAAFPGEDISDRPLPEAVVPAIVAMIAARPPSGRLVAAELEASR